MAEQPKDKYTALVYGLVAAVLLVAVTFGAPLTDEQRAAILGVIAPVVAVVQAIVTRRTTTDNGVVVAKAQGGTAVAADASVYPNGAALDTVPADASAHVKAGLLAGVLVPKDVIKNG